jgi:RNA polymerase sigma-70 factor (ECF subfamily)
MFSAASLLSCRVRNSLDLAATSREPIRPCRTLHSVTESLTDAALWERALTGDGDAFGAVYDRHLARVERHAASVAETAADADDIVAVTFLETWRRRESVRFVDGSLLPWLLITATNSGRNINRSGRRHRALLRRLPVERERDDSFERDMPGDASRALRRLSAADQRVLTLAIVLDLSERDIAVALDVPPGTVKSRLARAKRRLAAELTPDSAAVAARREAPRGT